MHDLVIRGATVVDGLGDDPISADVAIRDGRIVAIGEVAKTRPRSSMPADSR
jgi:N-acyl-D-amino-acid deacylase